MSSCRKIIIFFLLIMLIPVKVNAETEPELLMDRFVDYIRSNKQYKILQKTKKKYDLIGTYKITAYCPCSLCCGKSNGVTASGVIATPNHTIAADKIQFSFGDEVTINGQKYVVEDTGGAIKGNRIDMFFGSHSEALRYGRRYENLYIESEEKYVLQEIPVEDWVEIADELTNDEMITVIEESSGVTKWHNQAGDIVAFQNRNYDLYVKEDIYKQWKTR